MGLNKCQSLINTGGSHACVIINTGSPVNARSVTDAQTVRTCETNIRTHKTNVKSIQLATECNNLTKLPVLVDDHKRLNINVWCTRHIT